MVRVRAGAVSITGNYRDNNEDSLHLDDKGRFYIVADGMGGQAAGERASGLAVEIIPQKLKASLKFAGDAPADVSEAIDRAVEYANTEIIALGQVDPKLNQMGTTAVLIVHIGDTFYVGSVGDSRVYRQHSGKLDQMTKDHSLTQALCDAGTITPEEARTHRYKNVLYRYLGTKDGGKGADVKTVKPAVGERFLICSDGVTDGIDPPEINKVLAAGHDPQTTAEAIVKAAQSGGSRDNISCIVLFVEK